MNFIEGLNIFQTRIKELIKEMQDSPENIDDIEREFIEIQEALTKIEVKLEEKISERDKKKDV